MRIKSTVNHDTVEHMDRTLAKTIDGFSHYITETPPDLIIIHGDRVEALAGAIVGSINNVLVAHVEGGEISGTIDEIIRHAVSKMSHIHFVTNEEAKQRLIQLGERVGSIFVIGSPDLDLMSPKGLPKLDIVKEYYGIPFDEFAIAMFHPVTTEYKQMHHYAKEFVDALIESGKNYVVIYPNNDQGSMEILGEYKRLENKDKFRIFPSTRFEYFLTLLRKSEFIIGNSSAGIREAPYYGVPTIDIGSRQSNRANIASMVHCNYKMEDILEAINGIDKLLVDQDAGVKHYFGEGKSDKLFLEILESKSLWSIDHQKQFQEINS